MIECILFDSDGTLVDSELLSMQVLAERMAPYGADLDPDKLHDRFKGWKYGEAIEILANELPLQHRLANFEPASRKHLLLLLQVLLTRSGRTKLVLLLQMVETQQNPWRPPSVGWRHADRHHSL